MNTKIYDISFNNLVLGLVPEKLRNPIVLSFVKLLSVPFVFIYQDFLRYRQARLYELMITPQTCYLERMLRDRYDFSLRRIYIEDGIDKPPFHIYRKPELKPKYIYKKSEAHPRFIYTAGESGNLADDYIIWVPMDIVFDVAEMTSLVKSYDLPGGKFKIQRF